MLHYLFEAGITLKFASGALEILGGAILLAVDPQTIDRLLLSALTSEVLEDPRDIVARAVLRMFKSVSLGSQAAASTYLLVHGVIKVGLVVALWRKARWAYPVAGVVLTAFTCYQIYLFSRSHSPFQLALTVIDIVILALLRFEYVRARKEPGKRRPARKAAA